MPATNSSMKKYLVRCFYIFATNCCVYFNLEDSPLLSNEELASKKKSYQLNCSNASSVKIWHQANAKYGKSLHVPFSAVLLDNTLSSFSDYNAAFLSSSTRYKEEDFCCKLRKLLSYRRLTLVIITMSLIHGKDIMIHDSCSGILQSI